ncbi:Glu/Leu/Phe/Val family dehydrogenase [Amycolatopsis pithecellobii]|uniref:Valine dehydrogenase n=1 Tax=Amycolatopsis pithecellobii TaxID=664692 RepID=A0A6N7YQI8_9PSEU|nr:Glu/Leu/Phe/Val dehydrogenase dimerization domain-containing protein [Amycolatopsis pithecellobii]MTD55275.1 valine dehydrogenase [Amycolatopsis pithecellobii]
MNVGVFERRACHEEIVLCHDAKTGLKAIIVIYSTALGPALGGTRFYPYESEDDAIDDVLKLSKGMAYKNALAGLDLGGGKAVIIGNPVTDKTEPLLRAYGRFIESLGGRYITACDVGTSVPDMGHIAGECSHVTDRSSREGGAGNSSVLTAYGVYQIMLACAEYTWGEPSLQGRRVEISGIGKVGTLLVEQLVDHGVMVVVTDLDKETVSRVRQAHPEVDVVDCTDTLIRSDIDVYVPCALGGVLNDDTVRVLRARIVCGAANNQLSCEGIDKDLQDRGILYAPDHLVNAGGVIQVADDLHGFSFERAKLRVTNIYRITREVCEHATKYWITAGKAADKIAEQKIIEPTRGRNSKGKCNIID